MSNNSSTEIDEALAKCKRKLELIRELKKFSGDIYPTFTVYEDGGDDIQMPSVTYLGFEQLQALMKFCKEHNCSMGVIASHQEREIENGWMRVVIYPREEDE